MAEDPKLETRSVEELIANAPALVQQAGSSRQPIQIRGIGQRPVVLIDQETYEYQLHLLNLARLLMQGMTDGGAGPAQPLEEFIEEFADAKGIPGDDLRRSSSGRRTHS